MHRTHGITRNPEMLNNKDQGLWYYEELELGFNYRMTEISAALGNSQLNRLDSFEKRDMRLQKNMIKICQTYHWICHFNYQIIILVIIFM